MEMETWWKWRKLCIKINDEEDDENVHDKINIRRKVFVHKCKKEKLSKYCYGIIWIFTNGVLRTIDNDRDFLS